MRAAASPHAPCVSKTAPALPRHTLSRTPIHPPLLLRLQLHQSRRLRRRPHCHTAARPHSSFFLWKNFLRYSSWKHADATHTASEKMLNHATRVLVSSAQQIQQRDAGARAR